MFTSLQFSTPPRVIALALLYGTKAQHSFSQFPEILHLQYIRTNCSKFTHTDDKRRWMAIQLFHAKET